MGQHSLCCLGAEACGGLVLLVYPSRFKGLLPQGLGLRGAEQGFCLAMGRGLSGWAWALVLVLVYNLYAYPPFSTLPIS